MLLKRFLLCFWMLTVTAGAAETSDTLVVIDSQNPKDIPLQPREALKRITVPDGFRVTLFAGEPDVRQPIAFEIDDRGRLWVAECYAYRTWKATGNDRIVIFEDTDHDGQFDRRKIFWDKGNYLTGLQLGFGGVYICNAPHFSFIPDADGDDVPDAEPTVLLDGWSTKGVHNVHNGLTWGPEGWLYGLNGITAPSLVGKPGAAESERQAINCGVWRYHPTRHQFEVVCHGTTNPWGLDFDLHGQGFLTNCVIEHLWHMIPGAHYKRMFGQDFNPHTYHLMKSCSDHLHWAGKEWTKSRSGDEHLKLGGGHAHSGAMIYLGDNWPDVYRGNLLTCNIHGNRVNTDRLEPKGSGYTGLHEKDFLLANDPWFRGVDLKYGPDGGVFVSDWTDLGECHDKDGVHRNSGRIYKIVYGKPRKPVINLLQATNRQLVRLQYHKNEWYPRHARRLLQERAAAGTLDTETANALRQMYGEAPDVVHRLRAMWTLAAIGSLTDEELVKQLDDENAHLRGWAVRLLSEDAARLVPHQQRVADLAANDPAPSVRLEIASALQRLPLENRWEIAASLLSHAEDAADKDLPLMYWYAIEPLAAADKKRAVQLASQCKIPLVRQLIAQRVATN